MSEDFSVVDKELYYQKVLSKKWKNTPAPMVTLQRRTLGTALDVLNHVNELDFSKLSMNLYFFCKDLQMEQFCHLYESQIEFAAANPDKFVLGLHKFFQDISNKVKKENLYRDFFEFYHRCARKRAELLSQGKSDFDVLTAYMNLLCQSFEYLKKNKYDYSTQLIGMSTNGELLMQKDPYPNLDAPQYDLVNMLLKGYVPSIPVVCQLYEKYGYHVSDEHEIDNLLNRDKIHTTSSLILSPFMNEYLTDILPQTPFSSEATRLFNFYSILPPKTLAPYLKKRNRTLPSNGAVIKFSENSVIKELLLKETLYDNTIYLLYRMSFTTDGDICGFFDTKKLFFFFPIEGVDPFTKIIDSLVSLVLFCYGSIVLNLKNINITELKNYFTVHEHDTGDRDKDLIELTAEIFLRGGKLKNVYNPSDEHTSGTARKGNDDFTTETRAIQGFVRRLPIGQKPSQEAIEYAEQLGLVLEPNETYVRPFMKQVFKLKDREDNTQ